MNAASGVSPRGRNRCRPVLGPAKVVHENPYHRVLRQVVDFGSFTREYFVTACGQRAAVVVARGGEILLCRQYRRLLDRVAWEIPGGTVAPGESPEEAAIRECLEETGARCRELAPLIQYQVAENIENPTYVFQTRQCVMTKTGRDAREVERPAWVPLERCLRMVFGGEIVDSLSVIALLAYQVASTNR